MTLRIPRRAVLVAAGGVVGVLLASVLVAWVFGLPFVASLVGAAAGATIAAILVVLVLDGDDPRERTAPAREPPGSGQGAVEPAQEPAMKTSAHPPALTAPPGATAREPAAATADEERVSRLSPTPAEYKPTVEQLAAELLLMSSPEAVAAAVERTVRRWLRCEVVEFRTSPVIEIDDELALGIEESGHRPIVERRSEVYLDVMYGGVLLGQLHLAGKPDGERFTSEDVDLLRTIANLAALAMAHARSYAELEQRRREQAAAWHNERAALVETVAAEIAHEVRYPINFFRSIFSRKKDRLDEEEIEIGCEEVERLERLVSGLRKVVTTRTERRSASVLDLANRVELLLRDQLGDRQLVIEASGPTTLRCDPDQFTQVLVNLVSNALDAAGDDGEVGICWSSGPTRSTLTVWDTGAGYSCEPGQLFAPWFTTKKRGTGLGLAIAHRIVRAHGWSIDPERRDGITRFVITIPRVDISDAPPSFPPNAARGPTAEAG